MSGRGLFLSLTIYLRTFKFQAMADGKQSSKKLECALDTFIDGAGKISSALLGMVSKIGIKGRYKKESPNRQLNQRPSVQLVINIDAQHLHYGWKNICGTYTFLFCFEIHAKWHKHMFFVERAVR